MKKTFFVLLFLITAGAYAQDTLSIEGFDGTTLPTGWTIINNDGNTVDPSVAEYDKAWIIAPDPLDTTNGAISSTSYFSPIGRADRWLISPKITLGDSGSIVSWKSMSYDPSFPDSYKVLVSTTGNNIEDFTDTLVIVTDATPYWTKFTRNLSHYNSKDVYIAFVNTTYNGYKLYLDSVVIGKNFSNSLSTINQAIDMKVYPNPFSSALNLHSSGMKIQQIKIQNILGKIVYEKTPGVAKYNLKIPLSSLHSGIYLLTVETAEGTIRKKIIKE